MEDRDRRAYKRVAVDILCAITLPNGSRQMATARNLSEGGLFIECDRPLPKGERVRLSVNLQHNGRLQKLEADTEVMHGPARVSVTAFGSGVRFLDLDDEALDLVREFVDRRPEL